MAKVEEPVALLAAVESGDVLSMLKAQRRLIAESLTTAAENTRPQFNNELNKLHTLIAAEEERVRAAKEAAAEEARRNGGAAADAAFDPSAV
ncbi:hypothetical protein [Nocardioides jejuensis]|uniref:Uncharacterized protein n=1 Tax=Nocardioides jejuensis TaxID=2502782 RepID=A0A4R1BYD7_9ACTN|nr:hypothetical protein [Nocardioides jejuensis]TCJ23031.1 hypothetical protein EPD65_11760 [Nocardioides jejuensis]